MAQRLSRSHPHLRLAFDSSPQPLISSQCTARRQFSATSKRHGKAGAARMRRQDMPARPAMTTAQSMQMKNMRKEDLPEEMGMLKVTYILPPSPSLFKDPKLRSLQLWEFSKQYFMEFWQGIVSKFFFWRGIPLSSRPPTLKKSRLYRAPIIPLQTLSHSRIIKDLHKRSYLAIQDAASTGNLKGIKETCGQSLTEHYTRLVSNYKSKKEIVRWSVAYKPWPFGIRIVSRKFGQAPLTFEGYPLGSQQVVARVRSAQTLTPGHVVGKLADGSPEIVWGKPKTRDMVETVVMQRKYVSGVFEPWMIFGFQSPKGTRAELEAWKEEQMRVPEYPGMKKPKAAAAAA